MAGGKEQEMNNKQSSFHMGDEFNGYGEIRYLRGTNPGIHPPISQENIHLSIDIGNYVLKAPGSIPVVIDPAAADSTLRVMLGSTAGVNRVIVKKEKAADHYALRFHVTSSRDFTDGSYPHRGPKRNRKVPAAMGVINYGKG